MSRSYPNSWDVYFVIFIRRTYNGLEKYKKLIHKAFIEQKHIKPELGRAFRKSLSILSDRAVLILAVCILTLLYLQLLSHQTEKTDFFVDIAT